VCGVVSAEDVAVIVSSVSARRVTLRRTLRTGARASASDIVMTRVAGRDGSCC